MNLLVKNYKALKKLILFQPSENPHPFVLNEAETTGKAIPNQLSLAAAEHKALLRFARRVAAMLEKAENILREPYQAEKIKTLKAELSALEAQKTLSSPLAGIYSLSQPTLDQTISTSLEENKLALEHLYNLPQNKDLIIRSITIPATPPITAQLVYMEGLVDNKIINLSVLEPLMLLGNGDRQLYNGNLAIQLIKKYLPSNQVKLAQTLRDVTFSLNWGDTAIFFDGVADAVLIETKGQEHRSVDRPAIEQSVRGSQSAFTETLRVNTGLVRSMLRTSDLTTEMVTIGTRSNTTCALMYLKTVINPALVEETRRRLTGIKVDSISSSGMLQQLIGDHPLLPFPQMLSTERPDRVAAALSEGRLAIFVDGSPFAMVAPISLFTLFHSAEDFAFSWMAGSYARLIRLAGALFTVIFPAVYIAISYFHQEAIPTDLILAIGGARERVPFPSIVEILAMELAFELLREGGIRIPGMLGSTIGIVGAIILGQAGVAANIVSPITVVVIAVTGLASFTIPDYSLAIAIRLLRFGFELLAATFGLVGVAGGIIATIVSLCGMKSLGVPYLAPVGPKTTPGYDMVLRGPVFSQEFRPDELNPQAKRRQANVSRQWKKEKSAGRKEKP